MELLLIFQDFIALFGALSLYRARVSTKHLFNSLNKQPTGHTKFYKADVATKAKKNL